MDPECAFDACVYAPLLCYHRPSNLVTYCRPSRFKDASVPSAAHSPKQLGRSFTWNCLLDLVIPARPAYSNICKPSAWNMDNQAL